ARRRRGRRGDQRRRRRCGVRRGARRAHRRRVCVSMTMDATDARQAVDQPTPVAATAKPPMYWRLLRLRNVHPNGWQRALFVEGVLGLSLVLVLADVA